MRTPIMAGNWKMNCDNDEAWELASAIANEKGDVEGCEVVLCPSATALTTVLAAIEDTNIGLGAQNIFWEEKGAYTGELSGPMLLSCGCQYVIIGHSERRGRFGSPDEDFTPELQQVFGDTDASVNRKIKAALSYDLTPIVCCGELLGERQEGRTDQVVSEQVKAALAGLETDDAESIILAYEPVWAIGTGEVCDAEEANRVIGVIRTTLAEVVGGEIAEEIRILYGGSVKPANVAGIMAQSEIDGGLVGGASLQAESFCELIGAAASRPWQRVE